MFYKIKSDVKHIYGYHYIQVHIYTYAHMYGPSFFQFLKTGVYITEAGFEFAW